jgi:hypothetical protein
VVAAAAVGSSAAGGDQWSDLDLTFAVDDASTVSELLADWTQTMTEDFGAAVLFDLPVQSSIYRVFLLPGALQVDLSFTPARDFGARGPRFHLIFGEAVERDWAAPPSPSYQLGLGIHHVVRAHICIQRGLLWQAEYWIHDARDQALTLACYRLGLDVNYARGFDRLPVDVREAAAESLVANIDAGELTRALRAVTAALLREADDVTEGANRLRSILAAISGPVAS